MRVQRRTQATFVGTVVDTTLMMIVMMMTGGHVLALVDFTGMSHALACGNIQNLGFLSAMTVNYKLLKENESLIEH